MSDEELRTALAKLAEPVPGHSRPGARDAVLAEVDRRRRRQRWSSAVAAAAVVTAAVVGTAALTEGPVGDDAGPVGPDNSQADVGWTRIADSPLSPRSGEVAVWTGQEMVVVGGTDQPPCPPNADCVGPTDDQRLADGAAYDPDTDTWRPIAAAPQSITYAQAVWTGAEVLVLVPEIVGQQGGDAAQPAATLAYDPATDKWRTLDRPPGSWFVLGGGQGDPVLAWQSEERGDSADWQLDVRTGSWTRLPADPFGLTYDRSLTWAGDSLILTALLSGDVEEDGDHGYRMARLDPATGEWTDLGTTPVGFGEPTWYVTDGQLVNPTQDWYYDGLDHSGGIYDLRTGQWRDLPEPDEQSGQQTLCNLPPIGVGEQWIAGGYGGIVSVDPDAAMVVPSCAPLHQPQVGVWAGDELIVYGGIDQSFQHNLTVGLRWTPPPPTAR